MNATTAPTITSMISIPTISTITHPTATAELERIRSDRSSAAGRASSARRDLFGNRGVTPSLFDRTVAIAGA